MITANYSKEKDAKKTFKFKDSGSFGGLNIFRSKLQTNLNKSLSCHKRCIQD
jgi:hypothetical protein